MRYRHDAVLGSALVCVTLPALRPRVSELFRNYSGTRQQKPMCKAENVHAPEMRKPRKFGAL